MMIELATFLGTKLADMSLSWSADKIASWWKEAPSIAAIAATARQFPVYPGLDASLQAWAAKPAVALILQEMAAGQLPHESAAAKLGEAFDQEFEAVRGGATTDQILVTYFRAYHNALLESEGIRYSVNTIVTAVGRLEQKLDQQMRLLTSPADAGLLPGEAALDPKLSEAIEAARSLLEEGEATAALGVLRVYEKSRGDRASRGETYELLATRGNAFVVLNRFQEAEVEFRAALQLKRERPNALANVGRALLYQGKLSEASDFAEQALSRDQHNDVALNVKAQVLAKRDRFDEARQVASLMSMNADREYLRGTLELWAERPKEGLAFMEAAHALDPGNASIRASLARAMLLEVQQSIQNTEYGPWGAIPADIRSRVDAAYEHLNAAVGALRKREDVETLGRALMDRAVLKSFLGDASAGDDYAEALARGFRNDQVIRQAASYWISSGQLELAAKELELFRSAHPPDQEIELLRAHVKAFQGDRDGALAILQQPAFASPVLRRRSTIVAIDAYLRENNVTKAREALNALTAEERQGWDIAVRVSEVLASSGDLEGAAGSLMDALPQVPQKDRWRLKLAAAHHLIALERWDVAATLLNEIIPAEAPKPLLRMRLACLFNADRIKECLELAASIRERRGIDPSTADIEAEALAGLGELKQADELYRALTVAEPEQPKWKLKRAIIALREDDRPSAKDRLPTPAEAELLSAHDGMVCAQLRSLLEDYRGALETSYRVLRRHPHDAGASARSIGIFLSVDLQLDDALHPKSVAAGTWVTLESEDGTKVHEILDDYETPAIPTQHRADSTFAKSLVGKSVGDEVTLLETQLGRKAAVVKEIRHKYVGVFQDTIQNFNQNFPGDAGIQGFSAGTGEEMIVPIRRSLTELSANIKGLVSQYGALPIPISTLAHMLGKSDLEAWLILASGELDQPMHVADGSTEAQSAYQAVASSDVPLVIELTSAIALHELGRLSDLASLGRPLYVARSTLDQLDEIRANRELDLRRKGTTTLREKDGQLLRQEISAEQLAQSVRSVEEVATWLREHCTVSGVKPDEPSRREVQRMMSRGAYDSLLLAKQVGATVLSEDLRLRGFGAGEFALKGIASFHLLAALVERGTLTREAYEEAAVRCIGWRYEFVPVNAGIMLTALKLDRYMPGERFGTVVKQLADPRTNVRGVVAITAEFFRGLVLNAITPMQREATVHLVLDALASRGWPRIERPLVALIEAQLRLHPLGLAVIIEDVGVWKQMRMRE